MDISVKTALNKTEKIMFCPLSAYWMHIKAVAFVITCFTMYKYYVGSRIFQIPV